MAIKNLSDPIHFLNNVGQKRSDAFSEIGLTTVEDLLLYFPTKYLDRTKILTSVKVMQYVINGFEGEMTIVGKVVETDLINYGKKQIFKVRFKDSTGFFDCIWFQGIKYFNSLFKENNYYAISSKPVLTKYGHLQFTHPDFDRFSESDTTDFINTGKIIPFYSIPKELRSKNLGDIGLRKIIKNAVDDYSDLLEETLPNNLLLANNFIGIKDAIRNIHFPKDNNLLNEAKKRIKYEELFYLETLVAIRKYNFSNKSKGIKFQIYSNIIKDFLSYLPFELTKDQLNVLTEIKTDMTSPKPMNRLLQGDVGSGKTIVALISILIAVSNGYQAVFMVPTEILANQHFNTISDFLKKFNFKIELLIGGTSKKDKNLIKQNIFISESDIIIGTHALLEENVQFSKLGLVIIDEQHRFGVAHRAKLIQKSVTPDVLIMTATPIPRTLTMTLYGDLDVSIIKNLPKNRIPVKTVLRGESSLPNIYNFIIQKKKENYQTFIIYPLVEESEKIDLKAAEVFYYKLKNNDLNSLKIGLIHGKMNWKEKDEVMLKFKDKEFDVLVATTVIEVGIDIPNANIIVINDAERFGLSQLHQLRGRVGRGITQAYCILVTKDELAKKTQNFNFNFEYLSKAQIEFHKAKIRLNAMKKFSNGFDLSEVDLKLRGPGDIFGKMQSGFPNFKFADLTTDYDLLIIAKEDAFKIIEEDNNLSKNSNRIIKDKLKKHYMENLKYSLIG